MWWHHKQKKFSRHIAKNERHLSQTAADTLAALGNQVAAKSDYAVEFNYLNKAIRQIQDTQNIVDDAASRCGHASSMEMIAASSTENKGMDFSANMAATSAASACRDAEEAVKNLKQSLQQELPQVNSALADNIFNANFNTLMADMIGGAFGTWSNWQMSGKLNDAEDHLRGVSGGLDDAIDNLAENRESLVKTALAQARKTDSALESFAATIENYMLPAELRKAPKITAPKLTI